MGWLSGQSLLVPSSSSPCPHRSARSSCELGVALLDCSCSAPDPQLVRRIVAQVEFYLSDENLAKDAFLLKHVQKNKMGFVSIKLLTSFKKVGPGFCGAALAEGWGEIRAVFAGAELGSALCPPGPALLAASLPGGAGNAPQNTPRPGFTPSTHASPALLWE